jgi:hypothetical protein
MARPSRPIELTLDGNTAATTIQFADTLYVITYKGRFMTECQTRYSTNLPRIRFKTFCSKISAVKSAKKFNEKFKVSDFGVQEITMEMLNEL